jgi:hypothetical protein
MIKVDLIICVMVTTMAPIFATRCILSANLMTVTPRNMNNITPGIVSVPSRIIPDYGTLPHYFYASIPFIGSSVFLTTTGESFVAVYEVVAQVLQPRIDPSTSAD